jgi:hypothetical protein
MRAVLNPILSLVMLSVSVFGAESTNARSGEDPLALLAARSELIATVTVTSNMRGFSESLSTNYSGEVRIDEVFKGDAGLKGQTVLIEIRRDEMIEVKLVPPAWPPTAEYPPIKKEGRYVLFLRRPPAASSGAPTNPHQWTTTDMWLSVHAPTLNLVFRLRQLAGRP